VLAPLADPRDRYQALTGRSLRIYPICLVGVMQCIDILPATVSRAGPCWVDTS